MSKKYRVAILGASGNVGQLLLDLLIKRDFPCESIKLLASKRTAGKLMEDKNGNKYTIEETSHESFKDIDIVLASAGSSVSKEYADTIVKAGAVIIDNSSAFRMDPDVPLVVPEVNPEA